MKMSALKQPMQACGEENGDSHSHARVSLIRNELATLTGNHSHAVILNQLLYWTQRTKDFHLMLEEEKKRSEAKNDSPQYGWIYKTANDLVTETMLSIDRTTIRRYLHCLIAKEWIQTRGNPQSRWDKTTQYRVNVKKIQHDLVALGHKLSELSFWGLEDALLRRDQNSNEQKTRSNRELLAKNAEMPNGQNALSNEYIAHSREQNALPKVQTAHSNGQIAHSNTETTTKITTEITNREHTQKTRMREVFDKNFCEKNFSEKGFFAEVLRIWNTCTNQEAHLTEDRKQRLQPVLGAYFQNDLSQWKQFCEYVGSSPFLMGHGPRKWRISLDWVLCEENLIKVLEGNFDDPKALEQKQAEQSKTDRAKEISAILASISDPVWKKWCSQLDFSTESRDSVSLWELKEIAHARFLEVEDDRLVWIGSSDRKALSRIEDLQWKILPFVQRIFPQARTLRTRLEEKSAPHQPKMPDSNTIPIKTTQQIGEHDAQ